MNLNDIIPSDLIDYAEKQGACRNALIWLQVAPRRLIELIHHNRTWAGWAAAHVFASRGDYKTAERLCAESYDRDCWECWHGRCAVETARRGDYKQAEKFCSKSDRPGYWCGRCAVEAETRGDYIRAEKFCAKSDDPDRWRKLCNRYFRASL